MDVERPVALGVSCEDRGIGSRTRDVREHWCQFEGERGLGVKETVDRRRTSCTKAGSQ